MTVLVVTGAVVLFLVPGAGGAAAMQASGNPLVEALGSGTAATVVNYIGLAGVVASFFSIIFAYSRQLFALSRAGYLPRRLSVTNARKAPALALIVPGVIGFGLSLFGNGATLLNMAAFGAALSYVLMMISHIVLRIREPGLKRPYRTPGGLVTAGFALVIAVLSVIATFLVDSTAAFGCLVVFCCSCCISPSTAGRDWSPVLPTRSSPRSPPRKTNSADPSVANHPSSACRGQAPRKGFWHDRIQRLSCPAPGRQQRHDERTGSRSWVWTTGSANTVRTTARPRSSKSSPTPSAR
jgi:hypothetical protein